MAFLNRCGFRPTLGGTATWTVSSAITGFRTPAACTGPAVLDQAGYYYFAESDDRSAWEIGGGVYTASGTTLTRTAIFDSTNGGAAVNFATPPRVMMGCPLAGATRELLTADREYFVRPGGSDSNSGLVDTNGGAFLTIQKPLDVIAQTLDLGGFTVTITVRAGTYTGFVRVSSPWVGAGTVSLQGDTTTPSNVIISTTGNHAVYVSNLGSSLTIGGFKIVTTTFGDAIFSDYGALVIVNGKIDYGACARFHHYSSRRSLIDMSGVAYDITGDATFHYYVDSQSAIVATAATATIGSARAFVQFANAATGGLLYASSWTATGAGVAGTTGTRFYVSENAIMYVNGGGINLFPGSVAGAGTNSGTAPYGLYI